MKKLILSLFAVITVVLLHAQNYRLVTPKERFVSPTDTITFRWSIVDSAVSYNLQVSTDSNFLTSSYNLSAFALTYSKTTLLYGNTYYWRISANTAQGQQPWSYFRRFTIFKPSDLASLVLWFDAAKNVVQSAGAVSQWSDLSPSALVATQPTAGNQPAFVSSVPQLCNKPVVRFNGVGSASTSTNLNFATVNLTNYTALMVRSYIGNGNPMQYVVGGVNNGLCAESSYYNGGFGSYQGSSAECLYASQPGFQVTGFGIFSTQRNHIYRNGVESPPASLIHTNCSNVTGLSLSKLGARADGTLPLSYKGDVGEIIIYDNALTDDNRFLAEQYLRYKFAPPVDLGPDTLFNKFCVSANLSSAGCFSSYLWSTGAATASVNVTAFGTYWVRATDAFGYLSTDTIKVRPQIPFHQLPHNAFLCLGDSLVWNTGYPASGFQFTWSTSATTPSIVIKTPGNYFVKIKDAFNCTFYSDTIHVVIDTFPNYSLGPDTSFCSGNRLNFVYADSLSSIVWSNGDTTNETIINTPGNYSVTAINSNGCIAKDTIHVSISGYAPTVNFTNPTLCATDSVLFTDATVPPAGNAIVWWTWNFGNNDTTNEQNPVRLFNINGQYTITLTAYTDSGCLNSITKTLSVYLKPHAVFQSNVSCALAKTQFNDFSTTPLPASVSNWKWHFANTDSSILQNPLYSFPVQGKYPVDLKVTNSDGCTNTKADTIEVFAPFSANFNAQNVCLGDSTAFTDVTASLSLVSWTWNTGDNYFSAKKNFKHKYAVAGNYNVTLQIQNAIGCFDSTSQTISIYKSPTAAFNDLITCEDSYYSPLDSSILHETVNNWKWNIDGTNYTGQGPQHFFPDTGNYIVKLTVTSVSGCQDSTSHIVRVKPTPITAFTFTPLYGDAPLDVTFTNQSTNASSYFWSFGDGITDIFPSPTHIYVSNDTFQIKLIAISPFACLDSVSKNIIVVQTDLDISVDDVETINSPQSDGTVLVSVTAAISNIGTRLITHVKLYATIGSGGVISEDLDTLIQAGNSMYYTFKANFVVAGANANSYVCVEAKSVNNGETEIRTDNNRQCASLNGVLQIIGPAPNPARGSAYLGLILPKAGKVTIDMVNLLGQTVMQPEELDLPAGRSDYNLPIKGLRTGEYFVRVKHNDDKLLQKLVVH